jgi:hypothetical protein
MVLVTVIAAFGVLVVLGMAVAVVGREARRLDAVAPRAVYDPDEAAAFVSERLPRFASGQITPAELDQVLRWHLGQLRAKGLTPPRPADHVQDIAEPVVVEQDGAVGYLIGRAELAGIDVPDEAVVAVIDQHFAYLDAIGAVGPRAFDDDATRLARELGAVSLEQLGPSTERGGGTETDP